MKFQAAYFLPIAVITWTAVAYAHEARKEQRLPTIGPAPDFALTSQDSNRVTLRDYRGKVVAVTFIYTSCTDTCPMLTDKMARIQDELGTDFGMKIAFVSISVDPARDTPEALKRYAQMFNANLAGWAFLTGTSSEIRDVEQRYGVFAAPAADGTIDHTFLTSLIDAKGALRVQYLGYRFDQEEFRSDLLTLVGEPD